MANDLASLVPATVTVAFPATGSAAPASGYYKVPVTLVSLGLAAYQNTIGAPWNKLLHRYEAATYSGGGSPTNAASLLTLATQIAVDWYLWQLGKLDQYFLGVVSWVPEGFHDIEFRQVNGRITTHVQRGKFNSAEDLIPTQFGFGVGPQLRILDGVLANGNFAANLLLIDPDTDARTITDRVWCIDLANAVSLTAGNDYLCHFEGDGTGGPFIISIQNSNVGKLLTNSSYWRKIVSNPSSVLAYVPSIVTAVNIANGAQTIVSGSSPSDFASTIGVKIVDGSVNITAGLVTVAGTDENGNAYSESVNIASGGTHTYTTTGSYLTVTAVTVSGLIGAMSGDTIQVVISLYPVGVLRTNTGTTYFVVTATAVAPASSGWLSVSPLVDENGYNSATTYAVGNYVQEILPVYAIGSVLPGPVYITSINGDTTAAQTFTVGTAGADFNIVDAGSGSHVWNLPDATTTARGAVTIVDQTWRGIKTILNDSPFFGTISGAWRATSIIVDPIAELSFSQLTITVGSSFGVPTYTSVATFSCTAGSPDSDLKNQLTGTVVRHVQYSSQMDAVLSAPFGSLTLVPTNLPFGARPYFAIDAPDLPRTYNGDYYYDSIGNMFAGGLHYGNNNLNPNSPPVITLNSSGIKVAINAPSFIVTGTGFNTNHSDDTITFTTLSATGTVASSPTPTATQMTITFGTPPNAADWLLANVTNSATTTSATVPVALIVPAPTITTETTAIGPGAQIITIIGTGFDPNPAGNIVTFTTLGPPTGTVQTVASDGTSMTVLITAPSGTGTLSAKDNSFGGDSNTTGVAVVGSTTGPSVTMSTSPLAANATTMTIFGNFFDGGTPGNNAVSFSGGATGTVTASTTNSLTVTSLSGLVPGPLTVVVTTNSVTSGAPVQVATVIAGPTINVNTAKLATNAVAWSLTGTGFDSTTPTNNVIVLSSGAATVTASTSTSLTFTIGSGPMSAGSLTATVTVGGQTSSSVQIATVVAVTVTMTTTSVPYGGSILYLTVTGANFNPVIGAFNPSTFADEDSVLIQVSAGTVLNGNVATWVAMDGSSLVVPITAPDVTNAGATISALVFAYGGDSVSYVQVATVQTLPTWYDTFTEASNTAVTSHTPNIGTGGYSVPGGYGSNGQVTAGVNGWTNTTSSGTGTFLFNPGSAMRSMSVDFVFQSSGNMYFYWRGDTSLSTYLYVFVSSTDFEVGTDGGSITNLTPTLIAGNTYTLTGTDDGNNIVLKLHGQTLNATTTYKASQTRCAMQLSQVLTTWRIIDITVR